MTITTTKPARSFDLPSPLRALILTAGGAMTLLSLIAIGKVAAGMVPRYYVLKDVAVLAHLSTVIPALVLGLYLLLTRKGTPLHKALGKLWLALMVTAALSALFIRQLNHGQFSLIHLFVPLTLIVAWRAIASARAGNIRAHRRHVVGMYLGALIIPGIFAMMPGRLMGAWLFG